MRKQEFFNLFSVAAILVIAIYFWGPGALRKKLAEEPPPPVVAEPVAKTQGTAANTGGSAGTANGKPLRPPPPVEISQLSACQNNQLSDDIAVRASNWKKILSRETTIVVLHRNGKKCLQKGQKVRFVETEYDSETGFPYRKRHTLSADVIRLAEFRAGDFPRMDFAPWGKLPPSVTGHLSKHAYDKNKKKKRWVMIQLGSPEIDLSKLRTGLPLTHPRGRTYTAKEALEAVKKNGALLIDVRSKFLFDRDHHELATHYPFFQADRARGAMVMSPTALLRAGLEVTGAMITADRNKQIIFYGRNRADMDPYNAMTMFAYRKFTNIGWVPGGVGELLGFDLAPPSIGFNGVISAEEVIEMSKFGAIILDVRSGPDWGFKKTLRNAIEKSYLQAPFTPDRFRLFSISTKVEDLVRAEEAWTGNPKDYTGKKLILVGTDYLDWRPYFTRKFLGDFGGSVYWYKGGIVDWLDRARTNPEKYAMRETSSTFGNLGKRMRRQAVETLVQAETLEFQSLMADRRRAQIDFSRRRPSKTTATK